MRINGLQNLKRNNDNEGKKKILLPKWKVSFSIKKTQSMRQNIKTPNFPIILKKSIKKKRILFDSTILSIQLELTENLRLNLQLSDTPKNIYSLINPYARNI